MAHPTRIFKTPDDLEIVWSKYKTDLKDKNKEWEKIQYVGKDGEQRIDYPKIPYTLEGLKRYCWDNKIGDISNYFDNSGELYNDFKVICSRIKNEIREDQIIGGMMGFYNPSITQRLNGLAEKNEHEIKGEPRVFKID